jgi:hypothetical protein
VTFFNRQHALQTTPADTRANTQPHQSTPCFFGHKQPALQCSFGKQYPQLDTRRLHIVVGPLLNLKLMNVFSLSNDN